MDRDQASDIHPRWEALLQWLRGHGMDVSPEKLPVIARATPGAGYGLFSLRSIEPSTALFSIPASALLNHLTLAPHYPPTKPELTCTQFISLHLLVHRPPNGRESPDPLFGPYISVLPQNFDFHPVVWLWKRRHNIHRATLENQLLKSLPVSILEKVDRILALFYADWRRVGKYLQDNPDITLNLSNSCTVNDREVDYLWAWLNVNTRCVYHRLAKARSDLNNMSLCPILDFANHTATPPYATVEASQAELWDTVPSTGRKFGGDFVLLSPSDWTSNDGEIFLRYGAHSNATLFAEYGFVNWPGSEQSPGNGLRREVEIGKEIEVLFSKRGSVGSWMREVLTEEGYWQDWTLHSFPLPAHPSYRLMTTLRLYHLLPSSADTVPTDKYSALQVWQDTMLGKRDSISEDNERLWRGTLSRVCKDLIKKGTRGLDAMVEIQVRDTPEWTKAANACIKVLWQEEIDVASAVLKSLEENEEF